MIRYAYFLLLAAVFGASAEPFGTTVRTVDSAGVVGLYSSLRLNGGNPVVSYYDATNGDLKLATCTAGCLGLNSSPTWVVTTVDSAGDVGLYTSLALSGTNPVIAYYDATHASLKLATCTAGCTTTSPTWVITTVDGASADVGRSISLQMNGANPVIAYYDKTNGDVKLATCTAACATVNPSWAISIVDGPGNIGRATALQLNAGRPVIAYVDTANNAIKVATCTANCATTTPTWVKKVVWNIAGDVDMKLGLALNFGNPTVSYYEAVNDDLVVATCTSACGTDTSTWRIDVADHAGDAGQWSSLAMNGGTPIVAYFASVRSCNTANGATVCHEVTDLRLALCDSNCTTPNWVVSTLDSSGLTGVDPSLQLAGDTAVVSYHDAKSGDLKVVTVNVVDASVRRNNTGLWWDAEESGWGINFDQQGDVVFATLFTYDSAGDPLWLVMSAGRQQGTNVFSGELYRTTGPAFNASPFTPIGAANITQVGTMTVSFADAAAALTYTVSGVTVNKTLRKQVFGARAASCSSTTNSRSSLTNYQDLWWNPAESGWGINFTHQGGVIFATLFTYDASGRAAWFVMSAGAQQADGSFSGTLYRTRGPAFNAVPFPPIGSGNITPVGTMQVRFPDGEHGTLTYSVDGATVTKSIVRQVFSSPLPSCAG